jgi:acyl-CoA synthetase (AMP-forming)/AMP-acid ligase II
MIFRSPHPDVAIPDVSVTQHALRRADELAGRTALVDGETGTTLTFAGLADAVRRAAGGLREHGLRKGDVCAICSPNIPEYAVAFHAVATAGGIVTTASPLSTADELTRQLRDTGARFLIAHAERLDVAHAAAGAAGVGRVFVLRGSEGGTPFESLLGADPARADVPIDPATDLAALPCSSGTTGRPKGVMLTHGNLVANMCQLAGVSDMRTITEEDVLIGVLPFYHIYGQLILLNYALERGSSVVTMPRFDPERFLALLQDHGVTVAYVVPPIVLMLARHPAVGKYDLSRLRRVNSGGAPLGEELARAAADRIGCPVMQGYGLTETSPVTHSGGDMPGRVRPGSIGPCLPNTEAKVVDPETGEALGPGGRGEICVRGPQVMKGYLDRPDATAAMIDGEGWLHTGDIGYADAEGDFYIVDRLKELIKYKGFPVAPAELEALLLAHPAVADVAVAGSPDPEAGEVPKAFVVATEPVGAGELIAWTAERVAPHKKIRRVEFVHEIPRAPSGKILRRILREREEGGR